MFLSVPPSAAHELTAVNAACDTVARMYLMICKVDGGHYGPATQEATCKAGRLGVCFWNEKELADVLGFSR